MILMKRWNGFAVVLAVSKSWTLYIMVAPVEFIFDGINSIGNAFFQPIFVQVFMLGLQALPMLLTFFTKNDRQRDQLGVYQNNQESFDYIVGGCVLKWYFSVAVLSLPYCIYCTWRSCVLEFQTYFVVLTIALQLGQVALEQLWQIDLAEIRESYCWKMEVRWIPYNWFQFLHNS